MKKPYNYELKKWLCTHNITGLLIHYPVFDSEDTCHTEVTIVSTADEKKRVVAESLWPLIDIQPNWAYLAFVKLGIRKEVEEWDRFAADEAFDLKEYERLKKKFGG